MFFYPVGLAVPYPRPELGPPLWQISGALLILVGLTAAALIARRKRPYWPSLAVVRRDVGAGERAGAIRHA